MNEERWMTLKEMQDRLGYPFRDMEWLNKALTHKSFVHEGNAVQTHPSGSAANEVLEFLGDAVISLAVSHLLVMAFPEAHEGTLSQRRSHLVRRATLASLSREFHLERYLLLGKGEMLSGGAKKSSILANTYEAMIGAIYMDGGFERSLEKVKEHLQSYFRSHVESETAWLYPNDFKSLLQEKAQQLTKQSPQYQVLNEYGPDHDKRFEVSVLIAGETKGLGLGKSKKEDEQEAARKALMAFDPEK